MYKTAGQVFSKEEFEKTFPVIEPRELLGHKLLEHHVTDERQERLMRDIRESIRLKLPAFRVSCMDPSEENKQIVFKPGNRPVVLSSPFWWRNTWKNFMPSKNSRSGTNLHWAIFLGSLMKHLIEEEGYSVQEAWNSMCVDSSQIGHYRNSDEAKLEFEPTGSRLIGGFFDLANTSKIIERWGAPGFYVAGGSYNHYGYQFPLADLWFVYYVYRYSYNNSTGWLIMDR